MADDGRTLRITLLGDLQVLRDGRALALPPSRKTRALLGFLALAPRPQPRQKLCDLLWEGPGDPRAALRWSLTKLRPLLDDRDRPRVVADKESAAIALADGELDLSSVRALVGARPATAPLEALRRAATLFRGELLEGLELPDCFAFHEWCAAQRDAARSLRLAILDALVAGLGDEPEEALARARERVAVDPLAERGHVAVVRLLGRLRRRREALEQYDACRRILESAFGARPSAEMERARLALTSPAEQGAELRSAAPVAAVRAAPAAFVGRPRELAALDALVAAAVAAVAGPRRQVLVVAGEPGIGKSRLLEELDLRMRRSGGLVLRGRAFEGETLRPYGAWLDALRGAPLGELTEVQRAELAPLLPELGVAAPTTDQGRLFDAVTRALAGLCRRGPLALILDDVQWLDEASASLLQVAARALEAHPAVIACATRPGELVDNPAALRAVRLLSRVEHATRLDLAPLSRAELRDLVERLAPGTDAEGAWDASEGNPLFAIEVARARQAGLAGSASLDTLIADRLASVGGRARDLLPWAAALGRAFQPERLSAVTGIAAAELLSGVDELERRGILRPSGGGGWDFAHDLFRRAAYQALSEPRRRLVHREIAHALAALQDPDGALASDVAHHAALGDDPALCAQASLVAGARAARLFASAEAREIVERALRLVAEFPPARRISVSLSLLRIAVDASRATGGDPALLPRIGALVEEARREAFGPEVAAGYAVLALAHWANRDDAGTLEATVVGTDALRDVTPQEAALEMAELVACYAALEQDLPRARTIAGEARRLGPLPRRAAANLAMGEASLAAVDGRAEDAAAILERLQRECREVLPWEESQLCARLALLDLELGRPERVFERTARMREVGPHFGDGSAHAFANLLEAAARARQGEDVPPEELEADVAALEADSKLRLAQAACALAEIDLSAGRALRARTLLRRACAAADAVSRPSVAVTARALLARAELACGDARAARDHVEAARRATSALLPTSRAVRLLREVAAAMGVAATPLRERGARGESAPVG
jgi:DNA-binding SARP family transcriptional activator